MKQAQTIEIETMDAAASVMSYLLIKANGQLEKDHPVRELYDLCAQLGRVLMQKMEEELGREATEEYLNKILDDRLSRFARYTDASEYNEADLATIN